MMINIEKELLYKACRFVWASGCEGGEEEVGDTREVQKDHIMAPSQLPRYYFGILKLGLAQIKLLAQKLSKLSCHLVDIKRKRGLSIITSPSSPAPAPAAPSRRWRSRRMPSTPFSAGDSNLEESGSGEACGHQVCLQEAPGLHQAPPPGGEGRRAGAPRGPGRPAL